MRDIFSHLDSWHKDCIGIVRYKTLPTGAYHKPRTVAGKLVPFGKMEMKLNREQESFIQATENLRQTIYEKELYLKAELVKKAPDVVIALSLQNEISETRGIFEQREHIIRMKKINLDAERK